MYTVYVLQSLKDGGLYIGFSNNLERRLLEHNSGNTKSNKSRVPFKVIYQESSSGRVNARKREQYLKSGCGREFLKQFKLVNDPR